MPKPFPSSEDTEAMVARVAPAILALLGDGVPRSRRAIVAALADQYPKNELRWRWPANPGNQDPADLPYMDGTFVS